MPRGPSLKAKIEEARDFKDARAILKKIVETTKFTERGAELLVGLHRKMTALAFERKVNPSTEEPWTEPSKHTTADKRFSGLLTRSGKLLQAATHPNVSYKTKDGATQATIVMPGEPRYGEFQEFGTSHVARRTPSVFVNARTKRVETSYARSNMLPARPFFPFAANDFTSGFAVKEISKSLQVVFNSIEKSFETRAIALPAAELEGYTSVVSFHSKGGSPSFRHSNKRTALNAEGFKGGPGEKLIRRDVRTKSPHALRSLKFHEALTEHMAPKVAPVIYQTEKKQASVQEGKRETAKQIRRRQQRQETAAYREQHKEDIAARLEEVGKGTLTNRLETGPLDRYRKKLRDLESRLSIEGTTEQYKQAVHREMDTLRAEYAVEHGLVFRPKDLEEARIKRLQEQTLKFNQRLIRFNDRIGEATTPEGKARIRKEMEAYRAAEYRKYHGMGGKPAVEPLLDASEANTRELAIAAEKRAITKEISEDFKYAVGGRPQYDEATAAKKHEEVLALRNALYREATAPAREQREKTKAQVKRAFEGTSFLKAEPAIKMFYQRIGRRNLATGTVQVKSARIKLEKGGITAEIAAMHEAGYESVLRRIKQSGGKRKTKALSEAERAKRLVAEGAKEGGGTTPKKTRVRKPKAETSNAPKGKPGRPPGPAKAPTAPREPKAAGAPKPAKDTRTTEQKKADRAHERNVARMEAERTRSNVEPLTSAQEAHNVQVRAEIKTLSAQRSVLRKAGQKDLVDTLKVQIDAKKATLHTPTQRAAAPMNVAQKATLASTQRRVRRIEQYASHITGRIKAAHAESRAWSEAGKPTASRVALQRATRLSKFRDKLLARRDLEMQNWVRLQEPSTVTAVDLKVTGPATSTVTPTNPAPRYGIKHRITTPKKENS